MTQTQSFESLVATIGRVHTEMSLQASRAVNTSLTLRNWLIGAYILEYEQQGSDRAQYGEVLFERLSEALLVTGVVRYHPRELRRCRAFYVAYPEIRGTRSPELQPPSLQQQIVETVTPQIRFTQTQSLARVAMENF